MQWEQNIFTDKHCQKVLHSLPFVQLRELAAFTLAPNYYYYITLFLLYCMSFHNIL